MNNRFFRMLLLVWATALLTVGCAAKPTQPEEAAPSAAQLDALSGGYGGLRDDEMYGLGGAGRAGQGGSLPSDIAAALNDPNNPLSRRTVYFDYDSAVIPNEYIPLLRQHASLLQRDPRVRVVLEGHTDERGSREYNLALGERRALAVRRFLLAEGVPDHKLHTLSYGEERPADPGHDERAWAQNRRVELVY